MEIFLIRANSFAVTCRSAGSSIVKPARLPRRKRLQGRNARKKRRHFAQFCPTLLQFWFRRSKITTVRKWGSPPNTRPGCGRGLHPAVQAACPPETALRRQRNHRRHSLMRTPPRVLQRQRRNAGDLERASDDIESAYSPYLPRQAAESLKK